MNILTLIRNLKIQYKISLIFIVILILMINLGVLTITATDDIRSKTDVIANQFVPKIVSTGTLKDSLNISIAAAYDYIQTGNQDSKLLYQEKLQDALRAQVDLFLLSKTSDDFEFTSSFQEYINNTTESLNDLVAAYESGADTKTLQEKLTAVSNNRDIFIDFLDTKISTKIQADSKAVQQQTIDQFQRTIIMVILAILLAIVTMLLLFSFIRRSVAKPIERLTTAAERIGSGDFSQTVPVEGNDEIGVLSESFNAMTTHIQEAQAALQQELEKTKLLDKQKTEFLSIAAHQLRTPMSGIKWVVQMTLDGDFGKIDDEARKQLQLSMENVDRMITLINGLLDVTRLETEGFAFNFQNSDLLPLFTDAVKDLFQAAEKNSVTVNIETPKEPLPQLNMDTEKISLVVHNLIDNAIKYTPKDGTVSVHFSHDADTVTMTVSDTGYGIPKEEQERIFSKFFRASNIQTVQADGSGLGLFMVSQIVKRHGGTIRFESEENKGTTFFVTLPIHGPKNV